MTRSLPKSLASAALALAATMSAPAQKATPVPQFDLDKLTGTWYQVARLPEKSLKKCLSDGTVLYALSEKRNSFQRGIFCTVKGGDHDDINDSGKLDTKHPGILKVRHWVIFSRPQYILDHGANWEWALVGSPNHKQLWVLYRNVQMPPDLYQTVQDKASAQGYPVAKLVPVTHPHGRTTIASPSANPAQIESPAPTPTKTSPASNSSGAGPGR